MNWTRGLYGIGFLLLVTTTAYAQTLNDKLGQSLTVCGSIYCSNTNQATANAGERNTSSSTLSYVVVRQETNLFVVSATGPITVNGGVANDSHLMGVHIATALVGRCRLGGFGDQTATPATVTFATATAAGFKDFYGAINAVGALTVTCDHGSDINNVLVLWRPR